MVLSSKLGSELICLGDACAIWFCACIWLASCNGGDGDNLLKGSCYVALQSLNNPAKMQQLLEKYPILMTALQSGTI